MMFTVEWELLRRVFTIHWRWDAPEWVCNWNDYQGSEFRSQDSRGTHYFAQGRRIQHPPHLRTIKDGWKTLQFFLICAPSKLFLLPGLLMCSVGMLGGVLGYLGSSLGPITLGAHTMLGSSLLVISGYQAVNNAPIVFGPFKKLEISKMKKIISSQILLTSHSAKIGFFLLLSGVLLWGGLLYHGNRLALVLWIMVKPWKSWSLRNIDFNCFGNDDLHFFGCGLNWK